MAKPTTTSRILVDTEADHAELRATITALRKSLQRRSGRVEEIIEQLQRLKTELEDHFLDEEDGGFFREAVERQPWLSERVKKLREEHDLMRGEAVALVACATDSMPALAWWSEVEGRFEVLAHRLAHHERPEVSLLQEAWTDDMGTKD